MGLFISVVASALCNVKPSIFHMVYKAVFFIDPTAVFTLQITSEGFRFSDTFHTAVAFNKLVDAFLCFLSCDCQ